MSAPIITQIGSTHTITYQVIPKLKEKEALLCQTCDVFMQVHVSMGDAVELPDIVPIIDIWSCPGCGGIKHVSLT